MISQVKYYYDIFKTSPELMFREMMISNVGEVNSESKFFILQVPVLGFLIMKF